MFDPTRIHDALAAVQSALAEAAETMRAQAIRVVLLGVLMGRRFVLEPQIFWPDALSPVLRRMVQPEQLAAYRDRPANPEARAAAHALRRHLIDVLDEAGATHFQIGRSYAGHPGVPAAAREAWRALKRQHDPDGIMNPGVLGL